MGWWVVAAAAAAWTASGIVRPPATSLGAADVGENGAVRGVAGRGRGRLEDSTFARTHAASADVGIARGGEGEGSGSVAVKKEDEEPESLSDGLPNGIGSHEQQKLQLSRGRSNTCNSLQ